MGATFEGIHFHIEPIARPKASSCTVFVHTFSNYRHAFHENCMQYLRGKHGHSVLDVTSRVAIAVDGAKGSADASTLKRRSAGRHMKQTWTLSTSFEHFGAARSRRHFGGSAISDDGGTVVVAMWEDEIVQEGGRVTYKSRFAPTLGGQSRRVSQQWISHLKWAISHCNACVRVVVLRAEDAQANPKVVQCCYPDDQLILQITQFNAKTGCFQARSP